MMPPLITHLFMLMILLKIIKNIILFWLKIKSIKKTGRNHKVYDLSVENNNNFFIGNEGNILTHNCDFLTLPAQASLRNVIETFSVHTRFILTCNYVERIIDALQSRCKVIKISPPSKKEVANHLQWVMDEENTEATIEDIVTMVNSFYPDMRKLLDTIQFYTKDGKLNIDSKSLVSSNYMLTIVEELKKKNPNFKNIRTAIINSGTNDFEGLYKYLFDNASEFAKSREGSVMVILNEHLYQSNFVVDKEICVSACLYKIIEAIKPQTI